MSDLSRRISEGCAAEIRRRGGEARVVEKPEGGHKIVFNAPLSRDQLLAMVAYVAGKFGGSFPEAMP